MDTGKIAVAMSGGVDSTVAALLLIQEGYDVEGFYLDISGDAEGCQSVEMAASKLGIPLHVINVGDQFEVLVIHWMISEYSSGNTPNPCVHCNKTIKWNYLFKKAQQLGFEKLATGHYARILHQENSKPQLLAGLDKAKDQSYFLSYLTPEDLDHTVFPLGELTKTDVRTIAARHQMPNVHKQESQDLCFMKEKLADFLKKHLDSSNKPGEIIDTEGNHLGDHEGLVFYTIGQRKGLRISSEHALYVTGKDFSANKLIVGPKSGGGYSGLVAQDVNWIEFVNANDYLRAEVKIRYRSQPVWANIYLLSNKRLRIQFDHPVRDVTPGQIAVFYNGEHVLGAGKIVEPIL